MEYNVIKKPAIFEHMPGSYAPRINTKGLAIVHATNYLPQNAGGFFAINTLNMATEGLFPRNTTHFTLNHKVSSHEAGSWNNSQYTIIGDFDKMCEMNGPPAGLGGADTFWTSGHNKPLMVPDATLVRPDKIKQLFEITPYLTRYKNGNFTSEDITSIRKLLLDYEKRDFDRNLEKAGTDNTKKDMVLSSYANTVAIDQTIQHLGYELRKGGKDNWQEVNYAGTDRYDRYAMQQSVDDLAKEIGSYGGDHLSSVNGNVERISRDIIAGLTFMDLTMKGYTPEKEDYINGEYCIGFNKVSKPELKYTKFFCHGETGFCNINSDKHNKLIKQEFFSEKETELRKLLVKADHNTQEVYETWLTKIQPDIDRINAYVEQSWAGNHRATQHAGYVNRL